MRPTVDDPSATRFAAVAAMLLACLLVLAPLAGCPLSPPDDGNTNSNDNDNDNNGTTDPTATIVNFNANFEVSVLQTPVSVLYTVTGTPDSIIGYYVAVADSSPNAVPIGDPIVIASTLPAGSSLAFSFDPRQAGVGYYRAGVQAVTDSSTVEDESNGVIHVQGPPDPVFIQPAVPVTDVTTGDSVFTSFDAGDPEGQVRWRLFYLSETDSTSVPPDELGTQLAVGAGNVGSLDFATTGLAGGDYQLGVSATDTGLSVATTVENGAADRVMTEFGPIVRVRGASEDPPTIAFTAPGAANVELTGNEQFTLRFQVTLHEPGATGEIELFYDDDSDIRDGYPATIVTGLSATATSYPFPSNAPNGTWSVGATVRTIGGVSAPVSKYATGKIIVNR